VVQAELEVGEPIVVLRLLHIVTSGSCDIVDVEFRYQLGGTFLA
jgi:hypothetical protein